MVLHGGRRGRLTVVWIQLLAVHHSACLRGFAVACAAPLVEQLEVSSILGFSHGAAGRGSCCVPPGPQRCEKEDMTPNQSVERMAAGGRIQQISRDNGVTVLIVERKALRPRGMKNPKTVNNTHASLQNPRVALSILHVGYWTLPERGCLSRSSSK